MANKPPQQDDESKYVGDWMDQIKSGLRYRKKYSTRNSWSKYRKYFRGQWASALVPINKTFSYGRTMMPKVYFRAPRVSITPTHPDMMFHARIVEALDNLLIQNLYLKHTMKMSALDSYLSGVGCIKLGYDSEFGFNPSQAIADGSETLTQFSTEDENEKIEYSQLVKPGFPWAIRCRPEDVIVPYGAMDAFSLKWVAHYILRPLDDVKADQKYRNTDKLEGTRSPKLAEDGARREAFRPRYMRDTGEKFSELWELRDFKTRKIMVFSEGKLLLADRDELQTSEGPPWEFLQFNPDPEYFWGIPDAHIIAPQQEDLNLASTQKSKHRAISLLKFLYLGGAMDSSELEKFLSGEGPGIACKVKGDSLANAIMQFQPHVPPELAKDMAETIQAMREELGFSQNQEGSFSPYHGKTASESMIVAQASSERTDERKDMMSDMLVSIIKKWNQFLFKFWTQEKVVQIVSPEGMPVWITYTGDQLKGDYELSIDADSGMPITRSLKYQMGNDLFGHFGGDPLIDQVMLRQIMLDNYQIVDPRVPKLIQTADAGATQAAASARQPHPAKVKGGHGGAREHTGGKPASSPSNPLPFEQAKARFEGGRRP